MENDFEAKQAEDDADILIVNIAIEIAKSGTLTAVVGNDADLLVLLTTLAPQEIEIFFIKPGRERISTTPYSSNSLNNDAVLKDHILFLHAFSGSDSTSQMLRKSKKEKKIRKSLENFLKKEDHNIQAARIFKRDQVSQFEVFEAVKTIFSALYYGKAEISLNKHYYVCFKKGVVIRKKKPFIVATYRRCCLIAQFKYLSSSTILVGQ